MRFKNLFGWLPVFALIFAVLVPLAHGQQPYANPPGRGAVEEEPAFEERTVDDVYKESKAFFSAGKYDEAIPLLSGILNASPNHVPAALLRGKAFRELGESQLALDSLALAVNYAMRVSPEIYGEALTERGKVLLEIGNCEEAADDFAGAVQASPSDPERLFLRGKAYARLTQSPPKGTDGSAYTKSAINSLTRAISVKDDYAEAYLERGQIYKRLGRFEEAVADFKKVAAINSKNEAIGRTYADLLINLDSEETGREKAGPATITDLEQNRDLLAAALEAAQKDSVEIAQVEKQVGEVEKKIAKLKPVVKVYPLRFADAEHTVHVLETLLAGQKDARLGLDSRTNRIVVMARPDSHKQLAEILMEIDVAPENVKGREEKRTFTGAYRLESTAAAKEFSKYLRRQNDIRSVSTSGTQFKIIANSQDALDVLGDVVAEMNEACKPQSRSIRIVWLTDAAEEKNVPDDMKPVVAELEKLGMTGMAVKSQLAVRTLNRFTSASRHGDYELSAEGQFDDELLSIQLEVNRHLVSSGRARLDAVINLSTQIEAPIGHPVVLGVSPAIIGHSAFVVVVGE